MVFSKKPKKQTPHMSQNNLHISISIYIMDDKPI